jgi:hypothetical protein
MSAARRTADAAIRQSEHNGGVYRGVRHPATEWGNPRRENLKADATDPLPIRRRFFILLIKK